MKKISIIITFLITINMFSFAVSAGDLNNAGGAVQGAENKESVISDSVSSGEKMEKVIRIVKSKINIPQEYGVFTSEGFGNGNRMSWRLHWSSQQYYTGNGGSLDITVDEFGNISNYNHYRYSRNYEYQRKLPFISKNQAIESAKKFIYYIAPEISDQLVFEPEKVRVTIEYDGSYRMEFPRVYKNIPFYENNVTIQLNGRSCEVTNFHMNWTENITFPEASKIIDITAAQKAFMEKIGLELKYKRTYGENPERTYLEYSLDMDAIGSGIDAFTGETVKASTQYNPQLDPGYREELYRREHETISQQTQLTEKELDEINQMNKFLSVEKAEALIRSMEELGIGSDWRMNRYSYNKGSANNEYILRMDFMKAPRREDLPKDMPEEKLKVMMAAGEGGQMAYVNIDAMTGHIISYSTYARFDANQKQQRTREELKKIADSFLNKVNPELLNSLELKDNSGFAETQKYMIPVSIGTGTFIYIRKVNGIPFEDNRIIINVDPGSGKITNYSESWTEISFIPADGVIGLDKAVTALFEKIGLELRYVRNTGETIKEMKPQNEKPTINGEISLIYSTAFDKPVCINANNGTVMNYFNAEPYREKGKLNYNDIGNHAAKERITALAEFGILVPEDNFRPDDLILQKEFLFIITKFRGSYPLSSVSGYPNQKEIDAMYATLVNEDIIDSAEKEPDGKMTREAAAKYILKAAGYKKFAEIEGLFKCDFTDKKDIASGFEGYVDIAKALGIIDAENGKILPKKQLTRAEAATMLYNYMKR